MKVKLLRRKLIRPPYREHVSGSVAHDLRHVSNL
jgi:hypothetical protein